MDNAVFFFIILWKKITIIYENSEMLSKKEFYVSNSQKKHLSEVNKFGQAAKQGSHFLMIFKQLYTLFLMLTKSSENIWFWKTIQTFWKNGSFVTRLPLFQLFFKIFIYNQIFYNIVWNLSLTDC